MTTEFTNKTLQAGNTNANLRGTDVLDAALEATENALAAARAAEQEAGSRTPAPIPTVVSTSLEDRVAAIENRLNNFNTRSGQRI